MPIAALYDIHGNLPALDAVLDQVRGTGVDCIVVGGDVLPGPMPRESLDRLLSLELPVRFIHGNGDREVLAETTGMQSTALPDSIREIIRWTGRQLDPDHHQVLASWPSTIELEIAGLGQVLFCHATPSNDTDVFTRLTPEDRLRPIFEGVTADLVVCGHTHMPFDRKVGRIRVVNAGSVGMPFGKAGADWVLLGPEVESRHTSYDLAAAAARITATSYPHAEIFAREHVLNPPLEAAMLETLSKVELR